MASEDEMGFTSSSEELSLHAYINVSGQKERGSLFLKLSESLSTEGTHVDVEET